MGCSIETYRLRIGINNLKKTKHTSHNQNKSNENNKKESTHKQAMIMILILILTALIPNTHYKTRKQHNKDQHTKNGNHTIKIVQWNKGKANFTNKTNELDSILSKHKPNLISICEANMNRNNNTEINNRYKDFNIEHTKMSINTNQSRNIMMIKEDLIYKRRADLEDAETSTVWIELKLPKNKPILVASIYRQWSLPQILNIKDSHGIIQQTERWDKVLDKWEKAISEKKEVIVLTDDNMDHENENYNNKYRIKAIKEKTIQFLTEHNITTHNKEPTYFVNQTPISCIDHIYSNCPQKITHITTINNGLSDHATLTATYHTKAPINNPKVIYTRPKHLLTEHNLNAYLDNNDIIQTAYNYTDPELIAEIIMREFNNIIEIIAPRTKRQVKKNYTPYLNKETREGKKKLYQMHNKAKQTQQNDDWREYKN